MLRTPMLRALACMLALASCPLRPAAADTSDADSNATNQRGPFSAGLYIGELYHAVYVAIYYRPWSIDLSPSFLVAANFNYRFYKWPSLPLQFEGEFNVGRRFDGADQVDISVVPVLRWTDLPWNKHLYTNVRVGALGISYTTGISAWEIHNSDVGHGSRFLHLLVSEVTFAASETAPGEFFIGVHHRSGAYGVFEGVYGGSSYVGVGYRRFW
jgi:hypothetical protein